MKDKPPWTTAATEALQAGQPVQVKPIGASMTGLIASGDLVTLAPCDTSTLVVGDIVLVQIQGRRYSHIVLHRVTAIDNGKFLIGANNGRIDGWVSREQIYGRLVRSEAAPDERSIL